MFTQRFHTVALNSKHNTTSIEISVYDDAPASFGFVAVGAAVCVGVVLPVEPLDGDVAIDAPDAADGAAADDAVLLGALVGDGVPFDSQCHRAIEQDVHAHARTHRRVDPSLIGSKRCWGNPPTRTAIHDRHAHTPCIHRAVIVVGDEQTSIGVKEHVAHSASNRAAARRLAHRIDATGTPSRIAVRTSHIPHALANTPAGYELCWLDARNRHIVGVIPWHVLQARLNPGTKATVKPCASKRASQLALESHTRALDRSSKCPDTVLATAACNPTKSPSACRLPALRAPGNMSQLAPTQSPATSLTGNEMLTHRDGGTTTSP
jgi:hypothetical protein